MSQTKTTPFSLPAIIGTCLVIFSVAALILIATFWSKMHSHHQTHEALVDDDGKSGQWQKAKFGTLGVLFVALITGIGLIARAVHVSRLEQQADARTKHFANLNKNADYKEHQDSPKNKVHVEDQSTLHQKPHADEEIEQLEPFDPVKGAFNRMMHTWAIVEKQIYEAKSPCRISEQKYNVELRVRDENEDFQRGTIRLVCENDFTIGDVLHPIHGKYKQPLGGNFCTVSAVDSPEKLVGEITLVPTASDQKFNEKHYKHFEQLIARFKEEHIYMCPLNLPNVEEKVAKVFASIPSINDLCSTTKCDNAIKFAFKYIDGPQQTVCCPEKYYLYKYIWALRKKDREAKKEPANLEFIIVSDDASLSVVPVPRLFQSFRHNLDLSLYLSTLNEDFSEVD